jgi:hypothetical protein
MIKDAIAFTVAVALAIAALFGISYLGYLSYNYFAPKYRAVDAQVFKESEQYNEGMVRDLEELELEYIKSTNTQNKDALKSIIIHRFEAYDENRLPADLRMFYNDLRSGRQ